MRVRILTQYFTGSTAAAVYVAVEETECLNFVDVCNIFNDISRFTMICMVSHIWMAVARFTLSFYRHEALLFVRRLVTLFHIVRVR